MNHRFVSSMYNSLFITFFQIDNCKFIMFLFVNYNNFHEKFNNQNFRICNRREGAFVATFTVTNTPFPIQMCTVFVQIQINAHSSLVTKIQQDKRSL